MSLRDGINTLPTINVISWHLCMDLIDLVLGICRCHYFVVSRTLANETDKRKQYHYRYFSCCSTPLFLSSELIRNRFNDFVFAATEKIPSDPGKNPRTPIDAYNYILAWLCACVYGVVAFYCRYVVVSGTIL